MPENNEISINDNGYLISTSAIQTLINNIKNADDTKIPKSILSEAYDIMYSSAANTPTKLAANTATTKKFLRMKGTGSAGAAPAWDTVTKSDVGLGNVENTKLSTWTGSTAITTLGTISTGTVPWARLSDVPTATSGNNATLGLVKIGNNIDISDGAISVPIATNNTLGLVKIGNNINVSDGTISVSAATNNKLGLVQIGDNIEVNNGVISVAKISSCIALNNKSLYLSRLQTDGSTTATINNGNITISPDGKVVTYTITNNDLGENASITDLSDNSVIMIAPVYGDNPNDNLCYFKIANDNDFDSEIDYYIFDSVNKIFILDSSVTQSNWDSKKNNLYTRNEDSTNYSSWELWDAYGIICTQDNENLNKLVFHLSDAVPAPEIDEDANLPDDVEERL